MTVYTSIVIRLESAKGTNLRVHYTPEPPSTLLTGKVYGQPVLHLYNRYRLNRSMSKLPAELPVESFQSHKYPNPPKLNPDPVEGRSIHQSVTIENEYLDSQ